MLIIILIENHSLSISSITLEEESTMSSQSKALSLGSPGSKLPFLEKIKPHAELIAALVSGVFILLGWLFSKDESSLSIIFYLLAFVIGGFAKAKN
jgi:Zn2+/Cd2+-exporting ATPase